MRKTVASLKGFATLQSLEKDGIFRGPSRCVKFVVLAPQNHSGIVVIMLCFAMGGKLVNMHIVCMLISCEADQERKHRTPFYNKSWKLAQDNAHDQGFAKDQRSLAKARLPVCFTTQLRWAKSPIANR